MSKDSIAFYYDIGCPFAYIAAHRLIKIAKAQNVHINWNPVLLGGLYQHQQQSQFPAKQWSMAKVQHNLRQLHQEAQQYNIPLKYNPHHPQKTVNAMRLLLCCDQEMRIKASLALFNAYWQDGIDFSKSTILDDLCLQLGLEPKCYLRPDIKSQLRHNTDEAAQLGIFGVPTFKVGSDLWWGQDRLLFVKHAIGGAKTVHFTRSKTPQKLTLYHDFASPYSYLGIQQMKQFEAHTGHKITAKPILLGALFKEIGTPMVPLFTMSHDKQQSVYKDLERWAEWWNIPFSFPEIFPLRSILPLRATIVEPSLTDVLYSAYWAEGKDISDVDVFTQICDKNGLDGALIIAKTQHAEVKNKLRENTQEAIEAGVYGVPSWKVNDEIWWGQDRLLSLAKYLS